MADQSYMDQVLGWLKGTPAGPTVNLAPDLPAYPSQHDADYARNYGFGDNNINEDYLNNNKARILGQQMTFQEPARKGKSVAGHQLFVPSSGADVVSQSGSNDALFDPKNNSVENLNTNPNLQGQLRNTMMQAALAANRSPIAALGFDPSKVIVDSMIKHPNILGMTDDKTDSMYTALDPSNAVVHESTHRGLEKLRQQFPAEMPPLLKNSPDEETIVRWLIKSKAGDPEGTAGNIDAQQRQHGIWAYNQSYPAEAYKKSLDQMQELAIQAMKDRGKRVGPQ